MHNFYKVLKIKLILPCAKKDIWCLVQPVSLLLFWNFIEVLCIVKQQHECQNELQLKEVSDSFQIRYIKLL